MANETFGGSQFLNWKTSAGLAGTYKPLGIVTGGGFDATSQDRVRKGINREQRRRKGLVDGGGSAEVYLTPEGGPLIAHALTPVAGVYTALAFGGDMGDGDVEDTAAYISKLGLKINNGDGAIASVQWMSNAAGSNNVQAVAITDGWNWEEYECSSTIGGASVGLQSIEYQFDFAVKFIDDIDGRTSGTKRRHRSLSHLGVADLKIAVEMLLPGGVTPGEDYPDGEIDVATSLVSNSTTPMELALGVTELEWEGEGPKSKYVTEDDLVVWAGTLQWRSKGSTVITCTYAAAS